MTADAIFEPHAAALRDCLHKGIDARYEMVGDDGVVQRYSARHYLSFEANEYELHAQALAHCRGAVWDLGAGAGRHSLLLQKAGQDVLAIDSASSCVDLMRERGVKKAMCCDVFDLKAGAADTLLLLDHGIGMAGTIDGLRRLLVVLRERLAPGGQILIDGNDARSAAFRKRGYTEVRAHLRYGELRGAPFRWLYIDRRLLAFEAHHLGLSCKLLFGSEQRSYLAQLKRANEGSMT